MSGTKANTRPYSLGIQPIVYLVLLSVGMVLRYLCATRIGSRQLQLYGNFNTPLIDLRELRELLYTYEQTGSFSARPLQVSQSEMYLLVLYHVKKLFEGRDEGIYLIIGAFEALSMMFQFIIFHIVFSATAKKSEYIGYALCWIALNPIQLVGGFLHLGSMNDCLFYLVIMLSLLDDTQTRSKIVSSCLQVIASYFDPRLLCILIPITVIQSRYQVSSPVHLSEDKIRKQAQAWSEFCTRAAITGALVVAVHIVGATEF